MATKSGQGTLSTWQVVSYAFGDVANNLTFTMTSMFLLIYMTDIAGIGAATASLIYGVTKVWAGVTDLVAGNTVDKTKSKHGRLRPWLLWISTPLAIVFVLLFSNPLGLSGAAIVAWVLLFDAAYQLAYSFINIPYGSLSAAMTQDPVDRSRLSGFRSIASSLTGVLLSAVVAPQFNTEAMATLSIDEIRMRFTITCAVLGMIGIVLYLICFRNSREVVPRKPGRIRFSETLTMLKQNRPLITLCVGALFLLASMFTMQAVSAIFVREVVGDAGHLTVLLLSQTVGTIAAASIVPLTTVHLGKARGYVIAAAIVVLAFVVIALTPTGSLTVALFAWFLMGFGTGGTNALMFSMQADTVDYGEWKAGIRAEGGSYSILSFVRKVGQGVGGALGGIIIGAFGYAVEGADPASVETGLRIAGGWLPAGLALLAGIVIFFYPLDGDTHRKLIGELNERRTRDAVGALGAETGVASDEYTRFPVVTLFEQYGAGAGEIGRIVADKLGVPYFDQKISSEELEEEDFKPHVRDTNVLSKFLQNVSIGGVGDGALTVSAEDAINTQLRIENTREVLEMVREKGGVVLGRNATRVLADRPKTLHVRLVAPAEWRVERMVGKENLPIEIIEARLEREDYTRVAMAQSIHDWDPSREEEYDLIINTANTTLEEAADLIVYAFGIQTQ